MSDRLLVLMEAATGTPSDRLNLSSVAPQVAAVEADQDEDIVEADVVDDGAEEE
jgi:hypothetical protein